MYSMTKYKPAIPNSNAFSNSIITSLNYYIFELKW